GEHRQRRLHPERLCRPT
ncbi:transketolase, partial [Vibrio cholerae HC-78A1]